MNDIEGEYGLLLMGLRLRILPIHGVPSNATDLYALTGYSYPEYKTTDFLPGGAWC